MTYDFYPLPPSLKPCKPIDTIDSGYLEQNHTILVNLLKKYLHIELYNEKWFNKPIKTSIPSIPYNHDTFKFLNELSPSFLSVSELYKETGTYPPQSIIEK